MNDPKDAIKKLREEISEADKKIVGLLAERLKLAKKVGEEKAKVSAGITDRVREEEVLASAAKNARILGIDEEAVKGIFLDIISLSKSEQEKQLPLHPTPLSDAELRIAFQGEPGAYSELAIKNNFAKAKRIPFADFRDVFQTVEEGSADCALVPVENSTEGGVNQVYDLLLERDVTAVAEIFLRIEHMLIARPGAGTIKKVYSHPQALAQCRAYLLKNNILPEPFYDTAGAVKMIAEKKAAGEAAIASSAAAEIYGMKIIAGGIEDNKNNYTRFLLVTRKENAGMLRDKLKPACREKYKTSLVLGLPHVPGSLYSVLGQIAGEKINLTKIESRPTKATPWEYIFYIDFEGSTGEEKVKKVLGSIKARTAFMKVLGSYPRGA